MHLYKHLEHSLLNINLHEKRFKPTKKKTKMKQIFCSLMDFDKMKTNGDSIAADTYNRINTPNTMTDDDEC
jgi:hypothetical protein